MRKVATLWQKLKVLRWFVALIRDPNQIERIVGIGDRRIPSPAVELQVRKSCSYPEVQAVFDERYLAPEPDLNRLASLPAGTLGREFARHLSDHRIDPRFYNSIRVTDDASYLNLRCRQTHDILHVLLGAGTTVKEEVHVQAFVFAQTHCRIAPALFGIAFIHTLLKMPHELPSTVERLVLGWSQGLKAKPFLAVKWEQYWEQPLEELRVNLGLEAPS